MPLFDDAHCVHTADFFAVWRVGDVVGVRIVGELTDARNPIWRAHVDAHFDAVGWPRYVALDVRKAIPMATLPLRIQSALWGKKVLSKITAGVLGVGKDARVGLTVGAIMRVAGMGNVVLCHDDDDFTARVARMERGEDPL